MSVLANTVGAPIVEAVNSMIHEIVALAVFVVTWALFTHFSNAKAGAKVAAKVAEGARVAPKAAPKPVKDAAEVADTIVNLCGDQFTRALRLYRDLVKRDLDKEVTHEAFYTAMVESAVRVGKADVAEQVIARMAQNGMRVSTPFMQSLVKLFAARKCYEECLRAHSLFSPPADPVVLSCLTLAASELGQLDQARAFLKASREECGTTSSREHLPLMRLYSRNGAYAEAVSDLRALMQQNCTLENIVVNTGLAVCLSAPSTSLAMDLLEDIKAYEVKTNATILDIVSYNTLMKAFAKKHDVKGCFDLLHQITARGLEPDDITYSTLLDACIDQDEHRLASEALEAMAKSGVKMNCVLLTTLMKGFVRTRALDKAMALYRSMRERDAEVKPDMITYSMLIKAHCDASDMPSALQVLEDMLEHSCDVDHVVFTHLLEGCCHVSNVGLAEKLFSDMLAANIKPSVYTITAMVKVYGKCGQSEKAAEIVATMEERFDIAPTVVVHTCLISGLQRQRKHAQAYLAFQRMEAEGVLPDGQCASVVAQSLADTQQWDALVQMTEKAFQRGVRVQGNGLNYALSNALAHGAVAQARLLVKVMHQHDVHVTVSGIARRLQLK